MATTSATSRAAQNAGAQLTNPAWSRYSQKPRPEASLRTMSGPSSDHSGIPDRVAVEARDEQRCPRGAPERHGTRSGRSLLPPQGTELRCRRVAATPRASSRARCTIGSTPSASATGTPLSGWPSPVVSKQMRRARIPPRPRVPSPRSRRSPTRAFRGIVSASSGAPGRPCSRRALRTSPRGSSRYALEVAEAVARGGLVDSGSSRRPSQARFRKCVSPTGPAEVSIVWRHRSMPAHDRGRAGLVLGIGHLRTRRLRGARAASSRPDFAVRAWSGGRAGRSSTSARRRPPRRPERARPSRQRPRSCRSLHQRRGRSRRPRTPSPEPISDPRAVPELDIVPAASEPSERRPVRASRVGIKAHRRSLSGAETLEITSDSLARMGENIDPTWICWASEPSGDETWSRSTARTRAPALRAACRLSDSTLRSRRERSVGDSHDRRCRPGCRWPHFASEERLAIATAYVPTGWDRITGAKPLDEAPLALARALAKRPRTRAGS